ncbi:hypothetical protein CEXT_36011 [Caerostris extrusa]|uniref:Uncharacterized protein n=1 Tax=Caerostris extrusa TaxID=172846 RepID=A0AAV4ME55_CAEEX|nr:hypothetical protein CEXT_36011 [Caerostris extrusa]
MDFRSIPSSPPPCPANSKLQCAFVWVVGKNRNEKGRLPFCPVALTGRADSVTMDVAYSVVVFSCFLNYYLDLSGGGFFYLFVGHFRSLATYTSVTLKGGVSPEFA